MTLLPASDSGRCRWLGLGLLGLGLILSWVLGVENFLHGALWGAGCALLFAASWMERIERRRIPPLESVVAQIDGFRPNARTPDDPRESNPTDYATP